MPTRSFSQCVMLRYRLPTRRFLSSSLLVCACSFASASAMAETGLRHSHELDTQRIGRVSGDERSLLRLEWRSGQSRLDENSLVGDMLGRLSRIETTTGELHSLIKAMPIAGRSVSTPVSTPASTPAAAPLLADEHEAAPAISLPHYGLAGAAALLLTFWLWQRRSRPAPVAATVTRRTAVPPAPTLVQPEPVTAPTEKTDTLELAELMLATGLPNDAAKILMEHIRLHPKEALLHWMKLLEVYRKAGNRFQFEKTARELKLNYNIEAENWAQLHHKAEATLEDFSRLIGPLQDLWPQPEQVLAYMRQLLQDNREGDRDGFPQPVAEELMLLIAIVKETSGLA